jgi:hypothetical protein
MYLLADALYQLQLRRDEHLQLWLLWKRALERLPTPEDVPAWGPSDADFLQAAVNRVRPGWKASSASDISSDDGEDMVQEEEAEDAALIGVLSALDQEPDEPLEEDVFW